jgi:hypothetical protein
MIDATNPVTDLMDFAHRSQIAAADAFETWVGIAQTITDATGSQAKNLRQIVHGLFDLVDQGFRVEREISTYLTIASRVTAAAADSCRELTDLALGTVEAAAHVAGRTH